MDLAKTLRHENNIIRMQEVVLRFDYIADNLLPKYIQQKFNFCKERDWIEFLDKEKEILKEDPLLVCVRNFFNKGEIE